MFAACAYSHLAGISSQFVLQYLHSERHPLGMFVLFTVRELEVQLYASLV
jgi:hypothetical protein